MYYITITSKLIFKLPIKKRFQKDTLGDVNFKKSFFQNGFGYGVRNADTGEQPAKKVATLKFQPRIIFKWEASGFKNFPLKDRNK